MFEVLSSLNILITIVLNSVSGSLLASISFSSFSGDFSCSSFGTYFFVSSFWLSPCVLGRTAASPSLGRMALHSRCSVGPSGTAFPTHLSWALQVRPPCELCALSYCSWALIAVGVTGRDGPSLPMPPPVWSAARTSWATLEELLCRHWLHDSLQRGFSAHRVCPWMVLRVEVVGL